MQRYPELERGESAAQSGRKHLPPALYKEAAHLNRQAAAIEVLLNDMNPFNTKKTREAIAGILKTFIPRSEHYQTVMKQYDKHLKAAEAENIQLSAELKQAKEAKFEERMEVAQLQANCANMQRVLARIPPEIIAQAKTSPKHTILHPEEAMRWHAEQEQSIAARIRNMQSRPLHAACGPIFRLISKVRKGRKNLQRGKLSKRLNRIYFRKLRNIARETPVRMDVSRFLVIQRSADALVVRVKADKRKIRTHSQ